MKTKLFLTLITLILTTSVFAGSRIRVKDVTDDFFYRYNIISAFPSIVDEIPAEENYDITHVYKVYIKNERGTGYDTRRVEVFITGGDWMEYPFVYFVTDLGQVLKKGDKGCKDPINGTCSFSSARYYLIDDLSTPDQENGAVKPRVDCSNTKKVMNYIKYKFLNKDGTIKRKFVPWSSRESY